MGAHRVPFDHYAGPLSQDTYTATTGEIAFDRLPCVIPVDTTSGAAALTLSAPTKAGIIGTVVLVGDGGDLTLTVTNGYNSDDDTDIVFDDVKDFAMFTSILVDGTYYWRLVAQEGTDAAVEEGVFDSLTVTTLTLGATAITATGAELNQLDGNILADAAVTEGAGITGSATVCEHSVVKTGGIFKTEILLDLTGLESTATDGDIIGDSGGGAAHIGQITAARNGTIIFGKVTCLETPAGGDDDIAIYSASESTGAYDGAVADLTETLLQDHGAWTAAAETPDLLDTVPPADGYLYLAAKGGDTASTYSAGIFLIELWGV